jgi:neurotransmitter:Na+ symporter, NSS family
MSSGAPTTWKRESGFIWSLLGSAIGFANILSFSAQCYKNGGGAFLIPFIAAILILGVPMLFLEGVIGHKMRLPIVSAFGQYFGKKGKFFGWLTVIAVTTIGGFYTVLTGYSVAYAYFAGTSAIPENTAEFFKHSFLQDSGNLTQFGHLSWLILVVTLACAAFSWFVLARNVRSGIEKICSIFLPILFAFIALFVIVVCFLPGAAEGFYHYLAPDFSKLLDGCLWRDVFGHVFFSFSLGLGIITGYSRHTDSTTSIRRAMWYVALGDFVVSAIAGFAIFGCVGYLSHASGVPFNEIVKSDSTFEMGFVIFPAILKVFTPWLAPIIGVIFFVAVFIAGITGVFSIVESITGNIQTEFGTTRKTAVTAASIVMSIVSVFFCMGNGQHILGSLAPMVLGNNMLLGGLAEVFVFMYVAKEIRNDAIWFAKDRRSWAYHALRIIAPIILVTILWAAVATEFTSDINAYAIVRWSWFLGACVIAALLAQKPSAVARPVMAPLVPKEST